VPVFAETLSLAKELIRRADRVAGVSAHAGMSMLRFYPETWWSLLFNGYGNDVRTVPEKLRLASFTNQSAIVWTLKTKSLLPSPAYRQAGFTKGRNSPSLAKRGWGDFHKKMFFQLWTS